MIRFSTTAVIVIGALGLVGSSVFVPVLWSRARDSEQRADTLKTALDDARVDHTKLTQRVEAALAQANEFRDKLTRSEATLKAEQNRVFQQEVELEQVRRRLAEMETEKKRAVQLVESLQNDLQAARGAQQALQARADASPKADSGDPVEAAANNSAGGDSDGLVDIEWDDTGWRSVARPALPSSRQAAAATEAPASAPQITAPPYVLPWTPSPLTPYQVLSPPFGY